MRFQSAKELVKLYGSTMPIMENWNNRTNDEKRAWTSSVVTGMILKEVAAPLTAEVPFDPPMLSGIQEPGYEAIDTLNRGDAGFQLDSNEEPDDLTV